MSILMRGDKAIDECSREELLDIVYWFIDDAEQKRKQKEQEYRMGLMFKHARTA